MEQARNAAIKWMEAQGGPLGPNYKVLIGRLGAGKDAETGVVSTKDPFRRFRLDYDPTKGPHYNVEAAKGTQRLKAAFCFPGTEEWIERVFKRRAPRSRKKHAGPASPRGPATALHISLGP
jgi:hypothetical protein